MAFECTKDQLTQWIHDEKCSSYLVGLYDCMCLLEEYQSTQGIPKPTKNPNYTEQRKKQLAEKCDEYLKTTLINKHSLYERSFSELNIILTQFDPLGFNQVEGNEHSYEQLIHEVLINISKKTLKKGIQIILLQGIYKIYRNFSFTLAMVEDLAMSIEIWLKRQDDWS